MRQDNPLIFPLLNLILSIGVNKGELKDIGRLQIYSNLSKKATLDFINFFKNVSCFKPHRKCETLAEFFVPQSFINTCFKNFLLIFLYEVK